MTLWFLFALMTAGAAFAVLWPLGRPARRVTGGSETVVYRDQLAEVEQDARVGLIGAPEAAAARVEIGRRLLAAADAESAEPQSSRLGPRRAVAVAALAGIPLLALAVYLCALPFLFFAGVGVVILLLANAYLLGREYFELAAMRFRPPHDAKAMRKANATYVFLAGLVIAVFVSIPVVNLATPIFAMAFMVHVHKHLSGARSDLIEAAR